MKIATFLWKRLLPSETSMGSSFSSEPVPLPPVSSAPFLLERALHSELIRTRSSLQKFCNLKPKRFERACFFVVLVVVHVVVVLIVVLVILLVLVILFDCFCRVLVVIVLFSSSCFFSRYSCYSSASRASRSACCRTLSREKTLKTPQAPRRWRPPPPPPLPPPACLLSTWRTMADTPRPSNSTASLHASSWPAVSSEQVWIRGSALPKEADARRPSPPGNSKVTHHRTWHAASNRSLADSQLHHTLRRVAVNAGQSPILHWRTPPPQREGVMASEAHRYVKAAAVVGCCCCYLLVAVC